MLRATKMPPTMPALSLLLLLAALAAPRTCAAVFQVQHDVQGVLGLHLALDVFSERAERRFFQLPEAGWASDGGAGARSARSDGQPRSSASLPLGAFPRPLFEVR